MNKAVFINAIDPNVNNQIEKIISAQEMLYSLQSDLEIRVGVLEIREDGLKLVIDWEFYDHLVEEFMKNLKNIGDAYQYLIFSKVAESKAADPPG